MNPDPDGFLRETSLLALGHFIRLVSQLMAVLYQQSAFCLCTVCMWYVHLEGSAIQIHHPLLWRTRIRRHQLD